MNYVNQCSSHEYRSAKRITPNEGSSRRVALRGRRISCKISAAAGLIALKNQKEPSCKGEFKHRYLRRFRVRPDVRYFSNRRFMQTFLLGFAISFGLWMQFDPQDVFQGDVGCRPGAVFDRMTTYRLESPVPPPTSDVLALPSLLALLLEEEEEDSDLDPTCLRSTPDPLSRLFSPPRGVAGLSSARCNHSGGDETRHVIRC